MDELEYIILAARGLLLWASNLGLNVGENNNFQDVAAFNYSQNSYPHKDMNTVKVYSLLKV